jgi:hypothetical protein
MAPFMEIVIHSTRVQTFAIIMEKFHFTPSRSANFEAQEGMDQEKKGPPSPGEETYEVK